MEEDFIVIAGCVVVDGMFQKFPGRSTVAVAKNVLESSTTFYVAVAWNVLEGNRNRGDTRKEKANSGWQSAWRLVCGSFRALVKVC